MAKAEAAGGHGGGGVGGEGGGCTTSARCWRLVRNSWWGCWVRIGLRLGFG